MMNRILVVNDDPNATAAMRRLLEPAGYMVGSRSSADLKDLGLDSPDLIILDVGAASPSRFEVCRNIRQDPLTRFTPIIFLAERNGITEMREAEKAGSDLYLTKPIPATRLINMVGMFLSRDAHLARKRQEPATTPQ